jgi:chemotaxis protein methyltransferase CheR
MDAAAEHYLAEESLDPRDFARLAKFIQDYSGIRMPPTKKTMVEGRLRRRVRALGLSGLAEYCDLLFEHDFLERETVHLIDVVSTNKTDFFREDRHFEVLAEQVVPEILAMDGRRGTDRPITVWSSACSTGAEPYTVAMVLDDLRQRSGAPFAFSIYATDICTEVLDKARHGVFPEDMMATVPADYRRRYFMRARDPEERSVRLVPAIRQAVRFGRLNLMDQSYGMPQDLDVVFCRNALIYFERPTQEAVLQRLCSHLRSGGTLFVGHSETLAGMDLPVRQMGASVFVKE